MMSHVGEVENDPPSHAVQVGLKRSNGGEIDLALDRHDPVPVLLRGPDLKRLRQRCAQCLLSLVRIAELGAVLGAHDGISTRPLGQGESSSRVSGVVPARSPEPLQGRE